MIPCTGVWNNPRKISSGLLMAHREPDSLLVVVYLKIDPKHIQNVTHIHNKFSAQNTLMLPHF
jgi:hypothetical protein